MKISKSSSSNQPVAPFYPPPWCYQPQPQPVVKPQSSSSSSSDFDSRSIGGDSSTSSPDIKKQELQLHRGASFVMKLPKVCFRPAHVSPGHDTRGVTLRGPAMSTRSSWELAWNGASWVGCNQLEGPSARLAASDRFAVGHGSRRRSTSSRPLPGSLDLLPDSPEYSRGWLPRQNVRGL